MLAKRRGVPFVPETLDTIAALLARIERGEDVSKELRGLATRMTKEEKQIMQDCFR